MTIIYNEDALEQAALEWLEELGYEKVFGPDIAPEDEAPHPERSDYGEVLLEDRLKSALAKINKDIPAEALEEAYRKITITQSPSLIINNRDFHKMITDGVDVEYKRPDGSTKTDKVWLFDFDKPENNDWAAVNQFTIIEADRNRRPDIIIFVNGLPLVVFELKSASSEGATILKAYNQLQTYKKDIPSLLAYNAFMIISDGINARIGSLTANEERFMVWRTIDGRSLAPPEIPQLEVMIRGSLEKQRLLNMLRYFILFQTDGDEIRKIVAGYHQYHAVNKAVEKSHEAAAVEGDRRIGVIWHTQGSGKSLSMVFYAGKLILGMDNPTIVVVTDRNDLDNQLFETFSRSAGLLRQNPKQAGSRSELRDLLTVEAGGIIFTTLQKFNPGEDGDSVPVLTGRRNVVVIADEAHRSQYGFSADVVSSDDEASIKYGYAKYMRDALPNASFIGFTGTPIEEGDKNTPVVFGDYIDIYDMSRAVEDGTTVRIFYESRVVKLNIDQDAMDDIDQEYQKVAQEAGEYNVEKHSRKWTRMEAVVGAEQRLQKVAQDFVDHYETRLSQSFGKAMFVAISRAIAVDLYNEIIKLRPGWHSDDDNDGIIKIVMTGSASDPAEYQQHVRNKAGRKLLEKRMKDENDKLKIVIVRDMWLTGFDVPCLHTMYVDKPMQGHSLMQAIARVNRVFKDKPGGLIVDYIGIADDLKEALKNYSDTDREGTGIDTEVAVEIMQEKYEILTGMLHGFDYKGFFTAGPAGKMKIIMQTVNFVLQFEESRQKEFTKQVNGLAKAYSLCATRLEAKKLNEEVGFFKSVKAALVKLITIPTGGGTGGTGGGHAVSGIGDDKAIDAALKQLVSSSIISEEVIDIFASTGLSKPDLSIISEEFLEELKNCEYRNVAVEILKRLLEDKIRGFSRRDLVTSRKFSEKLQDAVNRLLSKAIDSFQMLTELIDMANELQQSQDKGQELGLDRDEYAFYNALADNESAQEALGDEVLKAIAQELTTKIKKSMSVDWTLRESVRAKMRVLVKRMLKKYKYPPDKAPQAIETVMKQAELMCEMEAA